jgi:Flp pilus assembly protein TadB
MDMLGASAVALPLGWALSTQASSGSRALLTLLAFLVLAAASIALIAGIKAGAVSAGLMPATALARYVWERHQLRRARDEGSP